MKPVNISQDSVTSQGQIDPSPSREETQPQLGLGQWYWIKSKATYDDPSSGLKAGQEYKWLGCVMKIGSNFVELHSPHSERHGYTSRRVHFDDFWSVLTYEPDAIPYIQGRIMHHQSESARLLGEIQALTARLGISQSTALTGPGATHERTPAKESMALATLSSQVDVRAYEVELHEAKDVTLPRMFELIAQNSEQLSRWLMATTMMTQAQMGVMKEEIKGIEGRIFNVSLYAGLTEQVVQCSDGKPADMLDKLHVMQRRLYMDEECLLNYTAGGMEFKDIAEFDQWISQAENRDRILPFPRTLVAMRVRRNEKERDCQGDPLAFHINLQIGASDKFTFLYIRNGEQVWRLSCDMDFGALIFPDQALYSPDEPMMMKMFGHSIDKLMPVSLYEDCYAKWQDTIAKSAEWRKANPGTSYIHDPFKGMDDAIHVNGLYFRPSEWKPFDQSNVNFDEGMRQITDKIKEFNRIALIIQGLFDRSAVLHPHPPVKSWTAAGFDQAIKLVYDGSATLYNGDAPDFEAYRAKCNASLDANSVVAGQQGYWLQMEAEKENRRLDRDYRNKSSYRHKRYQPEGNMGPGIISRIAKWQPRSRKAMFSWLRERMTDFGMTPATLTVPASALFNISAYTPGDYLQFFQDPRTREDYLKWAPLLLSAEDYHAGKLKLRDE